MELVLDEIGGPISALFSCGGVVTLDSKTQDITRSGQYWAFAHFSRAIRRGARRFDTESTALDLQHTGAENADGQQVLIVTNGGAARTIELQLGNMAASVPVKANSVTSLAWR